MPHGGRVVSASVTWWCQARAKCRQLHCAELLHYVALGADTRPGTAAEIYCTCSDVSHETPMKSAAIGLYVSMWHVAGLPHHDVFGDCYSHVEALNGSRIDDLEHDSRYRLRCDDRHLNAISCSGRHHGESVDCLYAVNLTR